MAATTPDGDSGELASLDYELTATPQKVRDVSYNVLFGPEWDPASAEHLAERATAFENLATDFATNQTPFQPDDLQWDYLGLRGMLGRFARDAFGVHRLKSCLDRAVAAGEVQVEAGDRLWECVQASGVRINTPKPRKTRIAAAFSLWMATFRPVCVRLGAASRSPGKDATMFPAALNFAIATTYLSKFGRVVLGNQNQDQEIRRRIYHDLTFRNVSLSSLEMLYCGAFRSSEEAEEERAS